jgi:hypothetical protein
VTIAVFVVLTLLATVLHIDRFQFDTPLRSLVFLRVRAGRYGPSLG